MHQVHDNEYKILQTFSRSHTKVYIKWRLDYLLPTQQQREHFFYITNTHRRKILEKT